MSDPRKGYSKLLTKGKSPFKTDAYLTRNNLDSASLAQFGGVSLNQRDVVRGSVVLPSGTASISIAHNQPGVPYVLSAFTTEQTGFPDGFITIPYFINDGIGNPRILQSVNQSQISYLRIPSSFEIIIYYIIFTDPYQNK